MERNRAKEAGRKKFIWERANASAGKGKTPASAVMKQTGRYRAIDTARKQLREAQQSIAPDQEQESYTATEKVETYTSNAAHEAIRYSIHSRGNAFHRETDYGETPDPKAPTPQDRMRREAVREYRQSKTDRAENAFHHETDYGETPDPKAPTPKERMQREAVKEYRQSKADRAENAFHHETDYGETPDLKAPKPKERMRREAAREYRQRKTDCAENEFHRETDYGEQHNSVFLDESRHGEVKEQAEKNLDLLDESSVEMPDSPDPDLPETEKVMQDKRGEKRLFSSSVQNKSAQKAPTGQRQPALPRNSSSAKGTKKLLIKEQGRKVARNKSVAELQKNTANSGGNAIKALGAALSKALTPSRETLLYAAGALVLIIIPFVVIMGVASLLTGTGKGRDNYVPVSEDVEGYRPLIRLYADEFGIPEYEDLIAAVMMQESGGQGTDPMQCSESGYNTEYPREPGGITDPEYSIKVGVQALAEVLGMAHVESPVDLDGISLALQGYNYGPGYISWALSNYGGYSELNAIEYSDMMAEQYGWSGYGDKAYVSHVLRYYPIGRSFMSEGDAAIVAVAQTQIGNEGGLKYCEWYGYSYRVEWCAIFVSWCADQCGYLDAGILPKELNVIPYVEWFRERDQWQYMDYEPSPGDLIFYDWEGDGLADHVGIVERVEDGVIYSIEGNAGDLCIENSHPLGAAPVYGFGLPAY